MFSTIFSVDFTFNFLGQEFCFLKPALSNTLPPTHPPTPAAGGRVPGHVARTARVPQGAAPHQLQPHRSGRRRPVHLRLPRRSGPSLRPALSACLPFPLCTTRLCLSVAIEKQYVSPCPKQVFCKHTHPVQWHMPEISPYFWQGCFF